MFKCIIYFTIFLSFQLAKSQIIITGELKDDVNHSVVSGSVILKDASGKIITYTHSDQFGKYELNTDKLGEFSLSASSLDFESNTVEIILENPNQTIIIDFTLTPKSIELTDIIIQSYRPITIKNDTIVFNADAFKKGNEQTVEDLLRNIPGLNIDADGTIKVGNQEIEKVMIDGDDFFERGYKILTKNMPVNPIANVELLQNYSNNKHLKDIELSEKIALNLTLKEDYKRTWFGNALLGYGLFSKDRYDVKANLMNFGKKSKYYFLTSLNNTGHDATGDINQLIRSIRLDETASIGDDQNVTSLLALGFYTPNLKQNRTHLNNAEMLSLNSIFTLSEKIKLKTLGFLNTDEIDFIRNSYHTYIFESTTFTNIEDFHGRKKHLTGFGKIDFTYDISATKTLEYTGKFNKTNQKNSSDILFNNDLLFERLSANNQLIDQKLVYTNKFKDNKVWLLTSRYINEKHPQHYSVNQFVAAELFAEEANGTRQHSKNKMQFAGIEAHLFHKKKNDDLLEIKIGNQLRIDDLNTRFELLQNENTIAIPVGYQNNLTYTTNDLYLSAKYRFTINKFTLLTQADVHQLLNQLDDFGVKTEQNPFFLMPQIGLNWKINDKNQILTSYAYNTTNARVLDVYSGYVQTSFRTFSKGLGDFNQLHSSNAILNYTHRNWSERFLASIFVLYSKYHDFFSTNSIVSQNFSQTEKIIIKDREFFTVTSNVEKYFKPIKSNFKINVGATKTNFKNIVNNSNLREVKNLSANYGFEIRSGFRGVFNYHIGSKWNYNEVQTTITKSFTDNLTFLDLSFMFSDKFNFEMQAERYFFGSSNRENNQYYFMDFVARYVVQANKLTLFLSGNNLFNTETFTTYDISDISISQTQYRLMPRYVLLKMEYRF